MRGLAVALTLCATPALAHHEVVATASMLPLAGALASLAVAGLVGLRKQVLKRK